jgi:hypothetical protein
MEATFMAFQITCVNKANRTSAHERIHRVGGGVGANAWTLDQQEVVRRIEAGTEQFYVERPAGHRVAVVVAKSAWGHKYIKTTADGEQPDNLLALSECR